MGFGVELSVSAIREFVGISVGSVAASVSRLPDPLDIHLALDAQEYDNIFLFMW
jgi:hypothetical protein